MPFASTFAAFLSRAYDFVRMAAISRANIRLCGSHAGVSIGEDGPSQMALEDLAMMRAVRGSTVLYPCDPNQTAQAGGARWPTGGHRLPAHDPRGDAGDLRPDEQFPVGGSKSRPVVGRRPRDDRRRPGSRCTRRSRLLTSWRRTAISARVIDLYSVKPIDAATLRELPRRRAASWSSSRITGPRVAWGTPCWRPSRRRTTVRAS